MYEIGQTYSSNKSADTRLKNDQAKAKGLPTVQNHSAPRRELPNLQANTPVNSGAPVGGIPQPGNIQRNVPQLNTQINTEPDYDTLRNDVAFEHFLSSPEVQQAISKQKIRQHFKGSTGDPGEFASAVLDSMP